jgi:hypothetical protein
VAQLEQSATRDAAAAVSACKALEEALSSSTRAQRCTHAPTAERIRAAAAAAMRAHAAHESTQVAALALLDCALEREAAEGAHACNADADIISAAAAALRAHKDSDLLLHASVVLRRLVLAADVNARAADAAGVLDALLSYLDESLLIGTFCNHAESKMLATQRALFLALVALDAQRGLVCITKHLASREKCARNSPHKFEDATLPALLATLRSSSSAPMALYSVTLLRRLTDGSRHLLPHAATLGAWGAVFAAMRAHTSDARINIERFVLRKSCSARTGTDEGWWVEEVEKGAPVPPTHVTGAAGEATTRRARSQAVGSARTIVDLRHEESKLPDLPPPQCAQCGALTAIKRRLLRLPPGRFLQRVLPGAALGGRPQERVPPHGRCCFGFGCRCKGQGQGVRN